MGAGPYPPPITVRVGEEITAAVDAAAATEGLRRSDWVRELIVAALRSGAPLSELCARLAPAPRPPAAPPALPPTVRRGAGSAAAPRTLGVVARRCLHPPHRLSHFETFSRCDACGERVNVDPPPGVPRRPLHAQAPAQ